MILKMVSVAVLALVAGMGSANAPSARDFGAPRELPPSSFKGQQYLDRRGCVFLRAGFGGQTNWVPRVSRDRRQLCGYPPSGQQVAVTEEKAPLKVPSQPSKRKPIDTVASTTTPPRVRAAAPRVVVATPAAPRVTRDAAVERTPKVAGRGKIGCYPDAPVAERFDVRGGGTIVMCTQGDGDLTNARAPRLSSARATVAPSGFVEGNNRSAKSESGQLILSTQNVPPQGYKNAWNDGRLNPLRGQGSAEGWYDQDGVWSRELPARLVEEEARDKRKSAKRAARNAVSGGGGWGKGLVITEPTVPGTVAGR